MRRFVKTQRCNMSNQEQDIHILRTDSFSQLQQHAIAWDTLALEAPQRLPMLSHAWVSSYLEHRLSAGERWVCLFAYRADRLVGVLPLICSSGRFMGIQYSRLRTPRDLETRASDILVTVDSEDNVLLIIGRLIEETVRVFPRTLCLEIHGVRSNSPTLYNIRQLKKKVAVLKRPDYGGRYINVNGDFQGFTSKLSKRLVTSLRKSRNKLNNVDGVEVEIIQGVNATEEEFLRFLKLEDSGWKGEAGTSILRTPGLSNFYSTLVKNLSSSEWLEWHFFKVSNRPLAGHLAVRFGEALLLLKIAYDHNSSAYAPGNALLSRIAELSFEADNVKEINCLTDMPWQLDWRMDISEYHNLYIYPYGILPLLCGLIPKISIAAVKRVSVFIANFVRPSIRKLYLSNMMFYM